MKITTGTKLWIVTDPTPASTLPDICFTATLAELELQILGAAAAGYKMTDKNMTIYTESGKAHFDARIRLRT